jgi:hypothetical protein
MSIDDTVLLKTIMESYENFYIISLIIKKVNGKAIVVNKLILCYN